MDGMSNVTAVNCTTTIDDGAITAATPCNIDAAKEGGALALRMSLACLGYVVADVAADGLTVQYARREPASQRGATQTAVYLMRTLGGIVSTIIVGFCMNGKQYNGSFDWSLSFNQICLLMAIPSTVMVPVSWFFIEEESTHPAHPANVSSTDGKERKSDGEGRFVSTADDFSAGTATSLVSARVSSSSRSLRDKGFFDDHAVHATPMDMPADVHAVDILAHATPVDSNACDQADVAEASVIAVGGFDEKKTPEGRRTPNEFEGSEEKEVNGGGGGISGNRSPPVLLQQISLVAQQGGQRRRQIPAGAGSSGGDSDRVGAEGEGSERTVEQSEAADTELWAAELKDHGIAAHSFGAYLKQTWQLLRSRAMFYVILFELVGPVIGGISTTASGDVGLYWAKVGNLQAQIFSLIGSGLFAAGLWLVRRYYLNYSWRMMLLYTMLFTSGVDMVFSYLTIFDIVRNQYFYLGETFVTTIPSAVNFIVAAFVIVEMADDGNEGLVFGLLSSAANLANPFSTALSNVVFGPRFFSPALSDSANFVTDSQAFRSEVAKSFTISYFFSFLSLAFLFFLPDQKKEAQRRKRVWGNSDVYAYTTIIFFAFAIVYGVSVSVLAMFPSTMCLEIAGGAGCDDGVDG
jgi:hypothetical protein